MGSSSEKLASRVFDILKGVGKNILVYNESGSRVVDPEQARRFFVKPSHMMVSLNEDGENSELVVYLGKSQDINDPVLKLLKDSAVHYNYQFTQRKLSKDITPKDFSAMTIEESNNPIYGTKKRSVQKWNEAKLRLVHSKEVNEEIRGSRSRNIKKMFIETNEGERFKFPILHLAGGRAMARHIGAGGSFHDNIGESIIRLSSEFKELQEIARHIYTNKKTLTEDAFALREVLKVRITEIKSTLSRFLTKSGYELVSEELDKQLPLVEEDDDLTEQINRVKQILNLGEDNLMKLEKVAKIVKEGPATQPEESGQFTTQMLYDILGETDVKPDTVEAAVSRLNRAAKDGSNAFDWNPAKQETNKIKFSDPLSRISYRLGRIAHRLSLRTDDQILIGNILMRITDLIDTAVDKAERSNNQPQVKVKPAEKAMVNFFMREIAQQINESMMKAGYMNWNSKLVETKNKCDCNCATCKNGDCSKCKKCDCGTMNESLDLDPHLKAEAIAFMDGYISRNYDNQISAMSIRDAASAATLEFCEPNCDMDDFADQLVAEYDQVARHNSGPGSQMGHMPPSRSTYTEMRELTEWFNQFDVNNIFGKSKIISESELNTMEQEFDADLRKIPPLNENYAFEIANKLVNNRGSLRKLFNRIDERYVNRIAKIINENWKEEIARPTVKKLMTEWKFWCAKIEPCHHGEGDSKATKAGYTQQTSGKSSEPKQESDTETTVEETPEEPTKQKGEQKVPNFQKKSEKPTFQKPKRNAEVEEESPPKVKKASSNKGMDFQSDVEHKAKKSRTSDSSQIKRARKEQDTEEYFS